MVVVPAAALVVPAEEPALLRAEVEPGGEDVRVPVGQAEPEDVQVGPQPGRAGRLGHRRDPALGLSGGGRGGSKERYFFLMFLSTWNSINY